LFKYFYILFPIFWLSILSFLSLLSGWLKLAESYYSEQKPIGKKISGQSAMLNFFVSAGSTLNFSTNNEGLFISVVWIFRFNHPTLFIPWNHISFENKLFGYKKLIFADANSVTFIISNRLFKKIDVEKHILSANLVAG